MTLAPAIGNADDQIGTIENVEVEEAERGDDLVEEAPGHLADIAEQEQVLLDLGKTERSGERRKWRAKRAISLM